MSGSVRALLHRPVVTRDGPAGALIDFYFDDRDWQLRYALVDPGRPMPRREVLVPAAHIQAGGPALRLSLGREALQHCRELDDDRPVYLQHDLAQVVVRGDPHLRSCALVMTCAVLASDARQARVRDLLLDDAVRSITGIVADRSAWLSARRVLIAPDAVERIDWLQHRVILRGSLPNAPARTGATQEALP